ncbi:MAG: hypothetical protein ACD_49C00074G0027 [uncultured bacterium (gcode 4)]|uniref:Uncharacterized protein n=1 Tax=uncultured bacterium (gcode 4) TaxID=1234023 RepID=K2AD36_9BACT|nr:MAG: hypothetical protein ACD_49C00074G0027 [uncultured bacterium (gcode 4)]
MKTSSVKSSVTIKSDLFERLKKYDNKSKIINEALFIFFQRKDYLQKSEENFWNEKIQEWLYDIEKWDIVTINPKWEKINKDILNKTLWK